MVLRRRGVEIFMARKRRTRVFFLLATLALAAGLSVAYMQYAPRRTPEGQPPLASIPGGDLTPFAVAFDARAGSTRVLAMLSPT